MNKNKTYGVIGVCGANGNLITRILSQRGYGVVASDTSSKNDCRFAGSLEGYDIKVFYGETPQTFFDMSDCIIPPLSLSDEADVIKNSQKPVLKLPQVLDEIKPDKPVFGITGTNGKTTSTTLLKKIASDNAIKTCEHGLEGMQGNAEYIPILQSRLEGDVAVLEVGTFGVPGSVARIVKNTDMSVGLILNITPDHLGEPGGFMDYAHVKGEFISEIGEGKLIVNGQDPTVMGLLRENDFKGEVITFGVDEVPDSVGVKECVCGREISVKEIISGCGYYFCRCGLTTPQTDYIATNVNLKNRTFDLYTPDEKLSVKMGINGLHNVYNVTGVIIAAHEFLGLSYDRILPSVESFTGVSGRMEEVGNVCGRDIYVDYAHNPAGVETLLKEFKKLFGDFTCVITVSSESGYKGDVEIFDSAVRFSKFIVPASEASRKIAAQRLCENPELDERIFMGHGSDFEKI